MKLYLSSYRIPDSKAFVDFLGRDLSTMKFGLVLHAKDDRPPAERAKKKEELVAYFSGLGFREIEEVDFLKYASRPDELAAYLERFDVIWMNGGNTFYLRSAIARAGGEAALQQALEKGVVYGGDSAGAILAGPTLAHFDNADDPSGLPQVVYEGLGLIDTAIIPHWGSAMFREILEESKAGLEGDGYKTLELTDREFVLVEDGRMEKKEAAGN